ncbi:hypothetical protein [Sorangium sp. So ce1099]|uniref:hypothetical protein n=1 Tax=Sorangium sp. So ce1099 TaxID=3133331 RepID=UPI003F625BB6
MLVAEGQAAQPNAFDPRIEAETKAGPSSPTWEKQFAVSLAGDSISVPYPLMDVTDPVLRAERTRSYLDVVTGAAPRESLLDSRDLFSEDAKVKLGLVPPPGASGRAVLTQLCSRRHDGRGNPALSRARFNVPTGPQAPRALASLAAGAAVQASQVTEGSLRDPPDSAGCRDGTATGRRPRPLGLSAAPSRTPNPAMRHGVFPRRISG